ncbi:DUF4440 domain-containing protein [Epibacterium sp. SM1969]|uniref:DUF4440 domain-containing protein n=1 Tax=Tritonibacter aquimaris TaxID=2663379 RepID=A0A844AL70_9RHOB|nr:DUF4440 domain-containing protein [Tritonibacter aquimaris]MQY42690.1 DUF4440 domain-containing protein [Tritonibacter aquimaris]
MKQVLASLLMLSLPQLSFAQGHTMTPDQQAALDLISGMTAAFQTGDIDTVMNSYENKAAVAFEPGAPTTTTEEQIALFTAWSASKPSFSYPNGHEVITVGDLSLHIAPWVMQAKTPDGELVEQSGLSVAVLRRQQDGSWRMVIDNPHGGRLLAE